MSDFFQIIADKYKIPFKVYGYHFSKSIKLPVVLFEGKSKVYLRDNFYDVNAFVDSEVDLDIPLEKIYDKKNYSWYSDCIQQCRNYVYDGWTQEEFKDPRILRVKIKRKDQTEYWKTIDPDKRDRFLNRYISTDWYKDWSSGQLIYEGELYIGTEFYLVPRAYCEGFNDLPGFQTDGFHWKLPHYPESRRKFVFAGNNDQILSLLDHCLT